MMMEFSYHSEITNTINMKIMVKMMVSVPVKTDQIVTEIDLPKTHRKIAKWFDHWFPFRKPTISD